jgi:thiamine monophosphate synthase
VQESRSDRQASEITAEFVNFSEDNTSAKKPQQLTRMARIQKDAIDYSIYLVTDSGLLSPSAKSFEDHIQELVEGGVTIVQLREKTLSTADFIKRGEHLLEITRPKKIPLIINDRLDVALAIDADGVHVGQDDMGLSQTVRLVDDRCHYGSSTAWERQDCWRQCQYSRGS